MQPRRPHRRRNSLLPRGSRKPLQWVARWADWFEQRGVYAPGEDTRDMTAIGDFGWLITLWLVGTAVLVLVLALAV